MSARRGIRVVRLSLCTALGIGAAAPARADGAPFEISEIASDGRTVAAEIADLDGDGRADLLAMVYVGIPPAERRRIHVRFQTAEGAFASDPDLEIVLPPESAAYDLADVLGGPGDELILLGSRGLVIFTFVDGVQTRRLTLPDGVTIGAGPDERGMDRLPLATRSLGSEPWLVIPGLGEAFLLVPSGELRARFAVGGRSNYFIQPPGPIMAESDIQLFFDSPRLQFGDVDGDGRIDAVSASRHDIRVFLRRPDGSFPREPDRQHWLARVSFEDHVRGSGSVRSMVRDVDSDGRADLVIAQISGGILNSRDATSIFLNRDGGWNLDAPDAVFATEHAVSGVQLLDLDGDGRLELLRIRVPLTVLELIEVLVTRALDAHALAYGMDGDARFAAEPRFERKLGVPLSFETGRLKGFVPSFDHDWNADGLPDLLTSGDGTGLEIFLGGAKSGYQQRAAGQRLDSEGRLRAGDLDADGLTDFVLYNPRRAGTPIRLGRNRGLLPGTPPSLRAAAD